MSKIKIIAIPPGFAPEEIRQQWIGVEIPLTNSPIPEEDESLRIGNQNRGGYEVRGSDAVQALFDSGKNEAADFWRPYSGGNFVFKQEVCELVCEDPI